MVINEKKMNQTFAIYDKNNDNKISRKEFVKLVENFIDPSSM